MKQTLQDLTIADLYAAKSQCKEKEAYYRILKGKDEQYVDDHKFWADLLVRVDSELVSRLVTL